MEVEITRDKLARMYPRALPEWLAALERLGPMLCDHYGYGRLDWCGIAGQIDAETDGLALKNMAEDMRYSEKRMLQIFSKRLGDCIGKPVSPLGGRVFASKAALARALAGKPKELADCVYGGPRGREGTPPWQGSRFIGRGPLQCTHLNNYRASRDEIRKQPGGQACPDLVEHPELLASDPELGVRELFAQWKLKGLSAYARREDWATLSDVLNTGNAKDSVKPHGLDRRLRATARALAIWPDAGPQTAPGDSIGLRQGDKGGDVKRLQARLSELGFAPGPADGVFGVLTHRAVIALQHEHGLVTDGVVGRRTLEVLAITRPADGPHNDLSVKDLGQSSTVAAAKKVKAIAGVGLSALLGVTGDDQLGLGAVEAVIAKGEHVKGLVGRVAGLGLPDISGRACALIVAGGVLVMLWRYGSQVEIGRLRAAKRGG